jgi:hypothetical protein
VNILSVGVGVVRAPKAVALNIPTTTTLIICFKKTESIWGVGVPVDDIDGGKVVWA